MLQTQIGGSGGGGNITATFSTTIPDDDEPSAAVLEAEAILLCQNITLMINVADQCNVTTTPRTSLREQHGHATLVIFEDGGGM